AVLRRAYWLEVARRLPLELVAPRWSTGYRGAQPALAASWNVICGRSYKPRPFTAHLPRVLQLICGNEKDGATFYAARLFKESSTAQLMLYHADSIQAAYARATSLLTPSRTIRWPAGAH
ncbi:unnamed protein product, partial [Durusdinium trenchii]